MLEVETLTALEKQLDLGMANVVVQSLDLRGVTRLSEVSLAGAVFLGCTLDADAQERAVRDGALLFPELPGLPFNPYRARLYSVDELYEGFDPQTPTSYAACLDARVYAHWKGSGRAEPDSIVETLARRLHDHAITDAMEEAITGQPVVAIMGGHGMPRSRDAYANVARIARELSNKGILLASGGGPGAMEATHVGTWFAERTEEEMLEAIDVLAIAPQYDDDRWLSQAFLVRERWPLSTDAAKRHPSLGIPTWLYGHEPPNAFATMVAKYFANSVREDGLLAIAKAGVIYAPGSAGTIQEIFQDACQNHYITHGVASPMVFLDTAYWTETKPVYPLLKKLAEGRDYAEWLRISDNVDDVVQTILDYAAAS